MKRIPEASKQILLSLLGSQKLAVLSTYSGEQPYASLVAFAATEDLSHLVFVTGRTTRKFANMLETPRIAMLVDNRSNSESDLAETVAATILGKAGEPAGAEKESRLKLYLRKHPYMDQFATSAESAIVQVRVETFVLVQRFQEVTKLEL